MNITRIKLETLKAFREAQRAAGYRPDDVGLVWVRQPKRTPDLFIFAAKDEDDLYYVTTFRGDYRAMPIIDGLTCEQANAILEVADTLADTPV